MMMMMMIPVEPPGSRSNGAGDGCQETRGRADVTPVTQGGGAICGGKVARGALALTGGLRNFRRGPDSAGFTFILYGETRTLFAHSYGVVIV